MIVATEVNHELPQNLSSGSVDDGDVEFLDEQGHVGSGVGSADADVAQVAGNAKADGARFVDPVVTNPVVRIIAWCVAGGGFDAGCVGRRWC